MNWLLNAVYAALLLLLSPVILWKMVRHGRYRRGWTQKLLGWLPKSPNGRRTVWFHAVSVGEVLLLKKVVQRFLQQLPESAETDRPHILITTSTDTGFELASSRFPECTVTWFPLDFSWAVKTALRRVAPELVVLVELELWPNFLTTCAQQNVPTALINARMSDRSFRSYCRIRRLVEPLFRQFAVIANQNSEYAARLQHLGARPEVSFDVGSVKFDGATGDRNDPATAKLRALFGLQPQHTVLIAGSTQAPEEDMALQAWQKLHATYPDLKLILVPRHRERFEEVAALVTSSGIPLVRRSQIQASSAELQLSASAQQGHGEVILLDTIGELAACWGLADIAFVGGSFGSRGGQNMLEPAAYGAAVLVGPNTSNFKDIVAGLLQADAVQQLQTTADLLPAVSELLQNPERQRKMGAAARQFVGSQQGAVDRTVQLLLSLWKPASSISHRSAA